MMQFGGLLNSHGDILSEEISKEDIESISEQQLDATKNFLKLLPFILGFGWIVLIPIFYIFIAPTISGDESIKIGITLAFAIFTMIFDIIFMKFIAKNVQIMTQKLEEESIKPFTNSK